MYYIVHSAGGTYGDGHAYKIYEVSDHGDFYTIENPMAGVYFSLHRGLQIDKDDPGMVYADYQSAVDFVMHNCIRNIFKGDKIFKMQELAKKLVKSVK
jgi:hypothetical protein